jgi:signal transduction histidine kinase
MTTVRVVVADNGPGIDEADIPSIFQIFASTKGSSGTGLGLPVSQKIIREHGGRIVVESRVGQGASFIIELPMSRGEDSQTAAEGLTMID